MHSNVTCPNSRSHGRYWGRSSCKKSRALKIDVFKISDNKGIGKVFLKYDCFSWIKLIPVLIHLKY